jgi:hypothetical protein
LWAVLLPFLSLLLGNVTVAYFSDFNGLEMPCNLTFWTFAGFFRKLGSHDTLFLFVTGALAAAFFQGFKDFLNLVCILCLDGWSELPGLISYGEQNSSNQFNA